jgi:cysteine desulfurase
MIYMDNSATTPLHPEVLDAMLPYLQEEFGNPSSKYYSLAENARKAVEKARSEVAKLLDCESDEIIFTSGATESNNMILKGVIDYYGDQRPSIVTTSVEHPSILDTCTYLETKGINVFYLKVDRFGRISLNDLEEALRNNITLVSIIWGNNEVGSLNHIHEIAALCEERSTLFHTDATQVIGKIPVSLRNNSGIRFASLSGHKIHGPKGIGVACIRKQSKEIYTRITPLLHGGGQENNYRSGSLAVHNIVGLGKAAEIASKNLEANRSHVNHLEQELVRILTFKFGDKVKFNQDETNKIPGIVNVQFVGLNNELLVKKLSPYICISTGSACSSSKPSHVLNAMGYSLHEIRQSVRISLSALNTKEDLNFFNNL